MTDQRTREALRVDGHSVLAHKYNDLAECQACTPTKPTAELLRARAAWYRDGCDGLEDREGYWTSGDILRDVADDIEAALLASPAVSMEYVDEDKRVHCVDSPTDQHGYECVLCGHRLLASPAVRGRRHEIEHEE